MTKHNVIKKIKTLAKRYARTHRVSQSVALDEVARNIGFKHWQDLCKQEKAGWKPTQEILANAHDFAEKLHPNKTSDEPRHEDDALAHFLSAEVKQGTLRGHPYHLFNSSDDVIIAGNGWKIIIPEAPSRPPICTVEEHRADGSPVFDRGFRTEALAIANDLARKVRARIAVDWDRRCTHPAQDGTVRHPLNGGEAKAWYCHSCDAQMTGRDVAKNFWHCTDCGTTPLNIHKEPFKPEVPVESSDRLPPDRPRNPRKVPDVSIVETTHRLEINEDSVALLIRTALLEEAANTSERLGALCAEITCFDDDSVIVGLDEDLWPEEKVPVIAKEVARSLSLELDFEVMMFKAPFAWPDLGKYAASAAEYTTLMTAAYREHGKIVRNFGK
ncbi:hypothetical protein [Pseudooceanicola sp. MF1-13]|uniref:hypothetical protein n=1 Tax=Pseudooceanicola sp. MF1-13 TaxID=3379095 RepID=UPI00389280F3